MTEIPKEMREPRQAKPLGECADAWYYVNHKTIDVFAVSKTGSTPSVRITRRQLEQALSIMKRYE